VRRKNSSTSGFNSGWLFGVGTMVWEVAVGLQVYTGCEARKHVCFGDREEMESAYVNNEELQTRDFAQRYERNRKAIGYNRRQSMSW
jgi:hypothetical protein